MGQRNRMWNWDAPRKLRVGYNEKKMCIPVFRAFINGKENRLADDNSFKMAFIIEDLGR